MLGYIEGRDFVAEVREARGDFDRLPKLASEIVDTRPDVIVAVTSQATAAAKRATQTIPIVMTIILDPVGSGFVKSLARPGQILPAQPRYKPSLSPSEYN